MMIGIGAKPIPSGRSTGFDSRVDAFAFNGSAIWLTTRALKRASEKLLARFLKAVAAVDGMPQFFPYIPAVLTVRTTVNVFRFWRQPSVDMDRLVYRKPRRPKLIHFHIKPARMPRIQKAIVEPDVNQFMKERVGKKSWIPGEIVQVEFYLSLKKVRQAKFLLHP